MSPEAVAPSPLAAWALDPTVVHLNHGAFGGCPRAVLAAAAAIRARVEASPMRFFVLDWQAELDRARSALAAFVRAPDDRLAFVPNATTGVAIALASAALAPGDELLTTDHAYRACRNQLARVAAACGAHVITVALPLPFDADQACSAILAAVTPRTKLALLDHITSPTALILPVERLVPALAARRIRVIVDGAHAPGQIDLDVGALLAAGATWYAGNNHKWLCAPKSSGFLVAAPDAHTLPLVTSHGASPEYGPTNRFHAEFDWSGTRDPSSHLAVPTAIAEVARLGGDWPGIRDRNHALALAMRQLFLDAGASAVAPAASLGSMAVVPITLPPNTAPLALQEQLLRANWEVPVIPWPAPAGPFIRICAHLYNSLDQAEALLVQLRSLGVTLRRL